MYLGFLHIWMDLFANTSVVGIGDGVGGDDIRITGCDCLGMCLVAIYTTRR